MAVAGLALILAIGPAAGQSEQPGGEPSPAGCVPTPAEPLEVGSIVWDTSLSYYSNYIKGQQETAACLGITFALGDGQRELDTEFALVRYFIAQGNDLIIVATADAEGIVPVLKEADAAGIPVVAAGLPVGEGAKIVTFVGADDYAFGRRQGEMLVAAVGEEARVGVILGDPNAQPPDWNEALLLQGLTDFLADHPGIEIVVQQTANWDAAQALAVTQDWLSTYPAGELDAIVDQGPEGVDAARWAAENGRADVKFLLRGNSSDVASAIAAGIVYGTVVDDMYLQGVRSVQDAYAWLTGQQDTVERPKHFVAPSIVTIENVDEYPTGVAEPTPTPTTGPTPEPTIEPTPEPTIEPTPEPTPSQVPLPEDTAFQKRARRMCARGRPDGLYGVTARPAAPRAAAGMQGAYLVLVDYRDLSGKRRRPPRLTQGAVYDLDSHTPTPAFQVDTAAEVDVLACLAVRATRREIWRNTTTGILYTIDAADALIWMVDPANGHLIGRPWLRRPPKPGSGRNWIMIGKHGPGLRPPPEADIVKDIETFLAQ